MVAQGESCKTRKHSASQLPSGVPLSKISKSPISQHKALITQLSNSSKAHAATAPFWPLFRPRGFFAASQWF